MDKKLIAHLVASIFGAAPVLSILGPNAFAAGTDISNIPLANRTSDDVKPNIMLILDDSGSMRGDYMPEPNVKYPTMGPGRRSFQCNTIFYNPTITGYIDNSAENETRNLSPYLIPEIPDASSTKIKLNNSAQTTFGNAIHNGYGAFDQLATGVTGNLGTTTFSGNALPPSSRAVPSYYWRYQGVTTLNPASPECGLALVDATNTPVTGGCYLEGDATLYQYATGAPAVCTSPRTLAFKIASGSPANFDSVTAICSDGASPPTYSFNTGGAACPTGGTNKTLWERVVVGATSSLHSGYDETQRYAHWHTYYRTRYFMTKAAIGRAFLPMVSKQKYRAGFITINPMSRPGVAAGSREDSSDVYYYASPAYNSKYLELRDFSTIDSVTNQPQRWFDILYSQRGNYDTPLRSGLARVGRYYAGKADAQNSGMITADRPDPMTLACQQNYAILTTDGSWDGGRRPDGTDPTAGFRVDGVTLVGQQDGDLSEVVQYGGEGASLPISQRPVFDGAIGYSVNAWDAENQYRYSACSWYLRSDTQNRQSTWQNLVSTSQNWQSTLQRLADTRQLLKTTHRNLADTSQVNQYTRRESYTATRIENSATRLLQTDWREAERQRYTTQGTTQILQGTVQSLKNTSQLNQIQSRVDRRTVQQFEDRYWNLATTTQVSGATGQITRSTFQNIQNTRQDVYNTSQLRQIVLQQVASGTRVSSYGERQALQTSAVNRSTTQALQTTVQQQASTRRALADMTQVSQTTRREDQTTTQQTRRTDQVLQSTLRISQTTQRIDQTSVQRLSCEWGGGACTPVQTCVQQQEVNTCDWTTTGPSPVAACTAAAASSANNWATVSCSTAVYSAVPVQSCTGQGASAGNSWIATACSSTATSNSPVASCTSVTATSANSWTTTSCTTATAGPTAVQSCTAPAASANSWTTTTCVSVPSTVAVQACTSQTAATGNNWTTITCATPANTSFVGSCSTTPAASTANSWTTTTCSTATNTNVPVASCASVGASSANNWTTTTCPSVITTSNVPVASCTSVAASSANNWTTTTCPTTVTTANVPVASCTSVAASSANNWTTTTCPTAVTSGPTPVSTCTSVAASSANSYTTTTCSSSTSAWAAAATCAAATAGSANSWTNTSCSTSSTGNVAVASCASIGASAGNSYATTTCSTSATGNVAVSSCTSIGASVGNSYATTTCATPTTITGVTSCASQTASLGNTYVTISCSTVVTSNNPIAVCSTVPAATGNSYTTTTCPGPLTASTPIETCATQGASAGNSYTTTTCASSVTGPTAVGSCTTAAPSSANNWTTTTCTTPAGYTPGPSCTPVSASSSNGWIATLCTTAINTVAANCTPATADATNSWTATVCTTSSQINVAVASCTPVAASSGNGWMTVNCHTNDVTAAVQTCAAQTAASGNSWITITCATPATTLATTSCTSDAASTGNSWTTTSCTRIDTSVGFSGCTSAAPSSANAWTTTTCTNSVTSNIAVPSCTTAAPSSANSWTSVTCTTNTTSGVRVASCTSATASSGNTYTVVTCTSSVTGWVAAASCTSAGATSANSYTTITCSSSSIVNSAVASCASIGASAGNSYATTTCTSSNSGPTAVASCSAPGASAGNSYTTTTCNTFSAGPTAIAACSAPAAASGNSYTTTTCSSTVTPAVPMQTCSVTAAASGNSWTTTSCTTVTSTNVPVASCAVIPADTGNSWTNTSCPTPIHNSNVPIDVCVDAPADTANNWTTTTCASVVTSNVPIASCSSVAASTANAYTTTTCPTPITGGPTAVASCTSVAADTANSWTTTTCAVSATGPTGVATCATVAADTGNTWTTTTCASAVSGPTPVATCVTAGPGAANSYTTITCDTASALNTTKVPVQTCTTTGPSAGNDYVGTDCEYKPGYQAQYATRTQKTRKDFGASKDYSDQTDAFLIDQQAYDWGSFTAWNNFGQCGLDYSALPPTPGWPQVTQLPVVPAAPLDTTTVTTQHPPVPTAPASPSLASLYSLCTAWPCWVPLNIDSSERTNTLADVAQYYYKTDLRSATLGTATRWGSPLQNVSANIVPDKGTNLVEDNKATWQHMVTFTIGLGVSGQIAYNSTYKENNPLTSAPTDFQSIRCPSGVCRDWPAPNPTMSAADLADVAAEAAWNNTQAPKRVDDLWHAAVNGRGKYFNASDPESVVTGLAATFKAIDAKTGAGSGGTASNLEPVLGDDLTFNASFQTVNWTGDIVAQRIYTGANTSLQGTTIADSSVWSTIGPGLTAMDKLGYLVGSNCDDRNIYLYRKGAVINTVTTNFVPFTWNTVKCTNVVPAETALSSDPDPTINEQRFFDAANFPQNSWGQYVDLSSTQRTNAQNANLVNYLRGQRGTELVSNTSPPDGARMFRARTGILGDIINSQPVYLRPPNGQNADAGYADFKNKPGIVDRPSVLVVGANDGMLHAFHVTDNAKTGTPPVPIYTYATDPKRGQERWAFIPTVMLPKMYKLANSNYEISHDFFVDGQISITDVFDADAACTNAKDCWKTVLVGGLSGGGRGYYALDVTDPVNPKALWEFNWKDNSCVSNPITLTQSMAGGDCHVGLTYGKPLITKIGGRWVALLTSGYNNNNSTAQSGDNQGYLYVIDVISGKLKHKLGLGVGDANSPAGFTHINAYVDNFLLDNTALRIYGGDLLGNLWRIDVQKYIDEDNDISTPPVYHDLYPTLVSTFKDGAGTPQPITTRPQLMDVGAANAKMVFVGTGRYLGDADVTGAGATQTQSVYAIVDNIAKWTGPLFPTTTDPATTLRQQLHQATLSPNVGNTQRSVVCLTCKFGEGWFVDLPESGERINVEMRLALGTLQFPSNVPNVLGCDTGGSSWMNSLNAASGLEVAGSTQPVSLRNQGRFIVGVSYLRFGGRIVAVTTYSDGLPPTVQVVPVAQTSPLGRPVGWRDLLIR